MKVHLVLVARWRGYARDGQPADGHEAPDDALTRRALAAGWIVEVQPAPPAAAEPETADASGPTASEPPATSPIGETDQPKTRTRRRSA